MTDKKFYSPIWAKALASKRSKHNEMSPEDDMNVIVKSERIESKNGTDGFAWKHEYIKQDGIVNKTQTRHYRVTKNKWGESITVEVDANGKELPKRR